MSSTDGKRWQEIEAEIVASYEPRLRIHVLIVEGQHCKHTRTEYRVQAIAGNRRRIMAQCVRCGRLIGSQVSRKVAGEYETLPPIDRCHLEAWKVIRRDAGEKIREISAEKHAEKRKAFFDLYESHLESQAWRSIRAAVIARSGGKCEGCKTAPVAHVHHLSYENLGNEPLTDLEALCRPCHAARHPSHGHALLKSFDSPIVDAETREKANLTRKEAARDLKITP